MFLVFLHIISKKEHNMTPIEIFEYKNRWKRDTHYRVEICSDSDWRGKIWCRKNLERREWDFTSWTGIYQCTFVFQDQYAAQQFAHEFSSKVDTI